MTFIVEATPRPPITLTPAALPGQNLELGPALASLQLTFPGSEPVDVGMQQIYRGPKGDPGTVDDLPDLATLFENGLV